jgi:hypothetical protein
MKQRRQSHLFLKPENRPIYPVYGFSCRGQDGSDCFYRANSSQESIENSGRDCYYTYRVLKSGMAGTHVGLKRQADLMDIAKSLEYWRVYER